MKEGSTVYGAYTGFNALGQPSTLTLGNGAATTYTYDSANYRLKTLKTVKGAITLQDLTYTFDAGGNVTALADPVPGHGNQTFVYDGLARLTSSTGPYGTVTNTYDQIGNMLSNSRLSPSTYTYPASGSSSVRPHAVSTAGGNTYTYDANGNMTGGAGRTITYDYENRPVSVTKSGTTTTFVYDGDGGRVKKTVGTTTTTYIGKLYVREGTSCAKMIFGGGQRIAIKQVTTGSTSYFHPDHLGSTSVLTNSSGVKEQDLVYYPYGETYSNTGTANVAYKYTGKELDDSTGLYFYEARYYDAVLGRFISADTIVPDPTDPQAFNRYSYVFNNPLRYTDPTGHCPYCGPGGYDILINVIGPDINSVDVLPEYPVIDTPILLPLPLPQFTFPNHTLPSSFNSFIDPTISGAIGAQGALQTASGLFGLSKQGVSPLIVPFRGPIFPGEGVFRGEFFIQHERIAVGPIAFDGDFRLPDLNPNPFDSRGIFEINLETGKNFIQVNPSCEAGGLCFSPLPLGKGNSLDITQHDNTISIHATLTISAVPFFSTYAPSLIPSITFSLTIGPEGLEFSRDSSFPSFTLVRLLNGQTELLFVSQESNLMFGFGCLSGLCGTERFTFGF